MDRNDWIDLLAPKLQRSYIDRASPANALLDTRIPAACPDCKGEGVYTLPEWEGKAEKCHHDLAPTVEQVLTVGLRTLSAEIVKGHHRGPNDLCVHVDGVCLDADDVGLLRALRGEDA